ncbi:glycerate kinase [Amycolatopsis sp. 195334CR]|uniref:glycerate kinase n=1 Tax=Amycolatopsis sp. 195334CR TaxID=2814588 RepID=UPI001A8DB8BC|nr:glycerate kinase [Amycolatopsis sp. 195334CR]MBN6033573.1 glycerate kinase [Amycolatopsis sp. 195334CR]
MKVLIAPDKFKGSLTAMEAAEAIRDGVHEVFGDAVTMLCPVADGGEGTLDVLYAAGAERVELSVRGPLDTPVEARYAVLGSAAYIESARACGIEFVEPSPETALAAHTWGVGELIAHALEGGARQVVLTVGGTASTDGGSGMLRALGASVTPALGLGGGPLRTVESVDLTAVRSKFDGVDVRVATDVSNPLLGEKGAAAIFGPQKGARAAEVALLGDALGRWARALHAAGGRDVSDAPGAGAGGGVAGGAMAALGAVFESGFDLVCELTGVPAALAEADLVITGEGSLDPQSLDGKAPAGIAARARARNLPVLAVAGRVTLDEAQLAQLGVAGYRALIDHAPSLAYAREHAYELLRAQTADLVRAWGS